MGEDQANVGSGIVLEGGVVRWQTWVSQSQPPRHEFIDWGGPAGYDVARAQAKVYGDVSALLTAVQMLTWQGWSASEQSDAVASLAASPPACMLVG